jgi:hypothetical protein
LKIYFHIILFLKFEFVLMINAPSEWINVPGDGDCFYTAVCVSLGMPQSSSLLMRRFCVSHFFLNRREYTELFDELDRR